MSDRPDGVENVVVSEPESTPGFARAIIIGIGVLVSVIVVALVIAIVGGISGSEGVASAFRVLRDFFIIVLALQGILISLALVVLILQITALINLLRNEIKPLVDEARKTMTTVRGTSEFVSRNVAQPVIKVASVFAGAKAFFSEVSGIRRNIRSRENTRK